MEITEKHCEIKVPPAWQDWPLLLFLVVKQKPIFFSKK